MKCLDVVKEDMQEVGAREDEVFDRSDGESAMATPDGKSRKKILIKCQNDSESL